MENIGQQLDLGRGGPKVRKIQDGVVESLDKIIKKLEDELAKQQQSGQRQRVAAQPARRRQPAGQWPRHRPSGRTKNFRHKGEWGNLPPKEREEAIQQIGRDFPSHYRDVIEQYFRRLAAEEDNKEKR